MSKKYIIELDEDPDSIRLMQLKNGGEGVPVTEFKVVCPYKEPDLKKAEADGYAKGYQHGYDCAEYDAEQTRRDAYKEGYKDGKAASNSNLEQVRKEAYDKGFEDGKELCPVPEICHDNAYQKGLSDAWEVARKIDKMTATEFYDCFLEGHDMGILYKYTASEAIAKIKAWEDSKQKIKVGDEVDAPFGKAVVFDVKDDAISYLYATGETGWEKPEYVKEHKTGRNFPEIAAVFEKMKKE